MTELLVQVKKQLEQSQRQMEQSKRQLEQSQKEITALKQQVEVLTKRVEQTPVAPARGVVPATDAKDVVVMQQPGNLPGRTTGPPTTASGVGTPGAPQPVAAAPVSSGGDKIKVSLSGQIDRAEIYGDDGISNNIRNVHNRISSTRFRFVGEGRVDPETTLGTNFELEIIPNPSNTTTLLQSAPQAAANASLAIRQAEIFAAGLDWGDVRLGFGSTASYLTTEYDLSGTLSPIMSAFARNGRRPSRDWGYGCALLISRPTFLPPERWCDCCPITPGQRWRSSPSTRITGS